MTKAQLTTNTRHSPVLPTSRSDAHDNVIHIFTWNSKMLYTGCNRVHFPQMSRGNKKNVEPTLGLAEEVKTKSRDHNRKNLEKHHNFDHSINRNISHNKNVTRLIIGLHICRNVILDWNRILWSNYMKHTTFLEKTSQPLTQKITLRNKINFKPKL